MSGGYQEIADRIAGEIPELDRLVQRIDQRWLHGKAMPEQQDVYMDSAPRRIIGNC